MFNKTDLLCAPSLSFCLKRKMEMRELYQNAIGHVGLPSFLSLFSIRKATIISTQKDMDGRMDGRNGRIEGGRYLGK